MKIISYIISTRRLKTCDYIIATLTLVLSSMFITTHTHTSNHRASASRSSSLLPPGLAPDTRHTAQFLLFHVQNDTLQTQGLTNVSRKHLIGFTHVFIIIYYFSYAEEAGVSPPRLKLHTMKQAVPYWSNTLNS